MLKAALCGNYVNFGVFRLYGDSALDEALKMFVKLLVSIELKNLLVSPGHYWHISWSQGIFIEGEGMYNISSTPQHTLIKGIWGQFLKFTMFETASGGL